jgi:hypothetical protein
LQQNVVLSSIISQAASFTNELSGSSSGLSVVHLW